MLGCSSYILDGIRGRSFAQNKVWPAWRGLLVEAGARSSSRSCCTRRTSACSPPSCRCFSPWPRRIPSGASLLPIPGILLVPKQECSHFLASYCFQSKHIPIFWHYIGPVARIFPFPSILMVPKQEGSHSWHHIGPIAVIFPFPGLLMVSKQEYSPFL
jgi:hypothetical protein